MTEQEGEDALLVNKQGFPLSPEMWTTMWRRAEAVHPAKNNMSAAIQGKNIPKIPIPTPPILRSTHTVAEKLFLIQKYISELQYDYTGTQFFEIKKTRPLCRLMEVAKSIIKESLPIKCLEAVVLALYLTSDLPAIQRFPLAFKTSFQGTTYKHIVLGVYYNGRFGALGLSRRDTLMYKDLTFETLVDLLKEFIQCYKDCYHSVERIKIGLPVNHDSQSMEVIMWKYMALHLTRLSSKEFRHKCDHYSKQLRGQTAHQMKYAKESKLVLSDVSDASSAGSSRNNAKHQKLAKNNSG